MYGAEIVLSVYSYASGYLVGCRFPRKMAQNGENEKINTGETKNGDTLPATPAEKQVGTNFLFDLNKKRSQLLCHEID